jgi:hypothetical protein
MLKIRENHGSIWLSSSSPPGFFKFDCLSECRRRTSMSPAVRRMRCAARGGRSTVTDLLGRVMYYYLPSCVIYRKPVCLLLEKGIHIHCKCFFWDWRSTTQILTTRTHTHPYEYTYANPTPMSTSEGRSTGRSGYSRSHHWRLVVDGNVAYHLTYNAG